MTGALQGDGSLERIERWLFGGGLSQPSGAIAAWRDTTTATLAYEYPEITGYFLTLAAASGYSRSEVVERAARWLVQGHRSGEVESRAAEPGVVYTFDTFMQATGLLSHGCATGSGDAQEVAARLFADLAAVILSEGDVVTVRGGIVQRRATWSTTGRLHLLKGVHGLCLADAMLGLPRVLDAAELIVRRYASAVTLTSPQFADADGNVLLHPYCYALEGLWAWSAVTGDDRVQAMLDTAAAGLLEQVLPSGGYPRHVGGRQAQCDVTAQVARLATWTGMAQYAEDPLRYLGSAVQDLGDGRAAVAYSETIPEHLCSWASMFTAQALRMSREPVPWQRLV